MVRNDKQSVNDPPNLTNPFAKYIESSASQNSKLTLPSSSPLLNNILPLQRGSSGALPIPTNSSSFSSLPLQRGSSGGFPVPTNNPSPSSPISSSTTQLHDLFGEGVNTSDPFDLAVARVEYEKCKDFEEKARVKTRLQPVILNRLKDLSRMEEKRSVATEIVELIEFLKLLNPSDPKFAEFGNISVTSREGEIRYQEGVSRVKEAQEKLKIELSKISTIVD